VLQGEGGNRSGIGAKVTVHYNHTIAWQEQMPMRGFESTVDSRLNFGLGKATRIDSVVVEWPDGKQNVLQDVNINRHNLVDPLDDGVVVENAAGCCTRAHRDYPLRFGHLVVNAAQYGGHLSRNSTGDDHHVSLSWTRAKDFRTKASQIIA